MVDLVIQLVLAVRAPRLQPLLELLVLQPLLPDRLPVQVQVVVQKPRYQQSTVKLPKLC